jgi:hypothetical protein
MQLGAISSLLSTLPEMWQWTTAGLQYQVAGGGDAPLGTVKGPSFDSRRHGSDRSCGSFGKPRSRLAKGREEQARFDGVVSPVSTTAWVPFHLNYSFFWPVKSKTLD